MRDILQKLSDAWGPPGHEADSGTSSSNCLARISKTTCAPMCLAI